MRLWFLMAAALLMGFVRAAARADDFSADIPKLREFLDLDKSYSPAERAEAEAAFVKLKGEASNMSLAAFHLAVARITAMAHNGHTMLLPGLWMFSFNRIPLRFHVFADGMYVVHAPEEMRDLLGARIISIDGRSAGELQAAFGQYFGARESKRNEWVGFFIESAELLHTAGLAKASDSLEVAFELPNGTKFTRTLPAALDVPNEEPFNFLDVSRLVAYAAENTGSAGAVPFYLQGERRNFAVTALPELDGAYVQIRVNKDFYEQKIDSFFTEAHNLLKQIKPMNAIVDLRLDSGGDLNTTRDFLQSLPSMIAEDGKIFILTSGRTFSAGIASAGYLKQATPERVTIIGEPIGDFLEFWAEGEILLLKKSGAALLYASERHNYMTGCQAAECHSSIRKHPIRVKSLEPDIAAPLRCADYRAGRDVALEAVRKALGK